MKILLFATHPTQPIGYAKVAHKISEYLAAQPEVELHYFAISNFTETAINRPINPRIHFIDALKEERALGNDELYGVNIIAREIDRIKPDIFIIYNDIIVTCRLMNALLEFRAKHKYRTICYLDLVYPFEKPEFVAHVNRNSDEIWVFSHCWKKNLIDMNVPAEKISIIPHGYDSSLKEIDRVLAKNGVGLGADDFVVLNTNRNSYRKAWDITIRAFLIFLRKNFMNPCIKLFVNCHLETKDSYKIMQIIETECLRLKMNYNEVVKKHILHMAAKVGYLEDEAINMLYSAADVGINTCVGEGFGLCNMEHARLGAPQVVTKTGGLADIFADGGSILVEPVATLMVSNGLDGHNGDLQIARAEDFAEALDIYYKFPERRAADGKKVQNYITEKYNWSTILQEMWGLLNLNHIKE
jgi:D-inositol-3-phosphate glycosyltransferase